MHFADLEIESLENLLELSNDVAFGIESIQKIRFSLGCVLD